MKQYLQSHCCLNLGTLTLPGPGNKAVSFLGYVFTAQKAPHHTTATPTYPRPYYIIAPQSENDANLTKVLLVTCGQRDYGFRRPKLDTGGFLQRVVEKETELILCDARKQNAVPDAVLQQAAAGSCNLGFGSTLSFNTKATVTQMRRTMLQL